MKAESLEEELGGRVGRGWGGGGKGKGYSMIKAITLDKTRIISELLGNISTARVTLPPFVTEEALIDPRRA